MSSSRFVTTSTLSRGDNSIQCLQSPLSNHQLAKPKITLAVDNNNIQPKANTCSIKCAQRLGYQIQRPICHSIVKNVYIQILCNVEFYHRSPDAERDTANGNSATSLVSSIPTYLHSTSLLSNIANFIKQQSVSHKHSAEVVFNIFIKILGE